MKNNTNVNELVPVTPERLKSALLGADPVTERSLYSVTRVIDILQDWLGTTKKAAFQYFKFNVEMEQSVLGSPLWVWDGGWTSWAEVDDEPEPCCG